MSDGLRLRICPFCGKSPKWHLMKVRYCQLHGEPMQDVKVFCCVEMVGRDKEAAFTKWNTRVKEDV